MEAREYSMGWLEQVFTGTVSLAAGTVFIQSIFSLESVTVRLTCVLLSIVIAILWLLVEGARKGSRRIRGVSCAGLILVGTIGIWHWPLRGTILLLQRPLADAAKNLNEGRVSDIPSMIGPFRIARARLFQDRTPELILMERPLGRRSLILAAGQEVGNEWSRIEAGEWVLFQED